MARAKLLPSGFIEQAEKLISQADQFGQYTGDQKRKFVAKQLAKWVDERIKLGWALELIDGPILAVVFEWIIQVIFDLVQREKDKRSAAAAEAERLRVESEEGKRKKREV